MMFMVAIPASQIRDKAAHSFHAFSAQHNRRSSITRDACCIHVAARMSDTKTILIEESLMM
jgi:hypothetical protein